MGRDSTTFRLGLQSIVQRNGGIDLKKGTVTVEEPGTGRNRSLVRWVFQRPMNLEKLALAAQRVTGVGMLAYLMAHVFVTGTVTSGADVWASITNTLNNPLADLGDLLLIMGVAFHAVNGIRVLLLELTPLSGKPRRPDYPYKSQSLGRGQRSILYSAIISAILTGIVAVYVLWGLP